MSWTARNRLARRKDARMQGCNTHCRQRTSQRNARLLSLWLQVSPRRGVRPKARFQPPSPGYNTDYCGMRSRRNSPHANPAWGSAREPTLRARVESCSLENVAGRSKSPCASQDAKKPRCQHTVPQRLLAPQQAARRAVAERVVPGGERSRSAQVLDAGVRLASWIMFIRILVCATIVPVSTGGRDFFR